ncbi:hypothetical protein BRD13_07610 [Halobacteriales archaeon SW_5_70_135]|nr:MAG: hypothetical protein BRD13_07610 [Halobacteriales archaeon SW_5_70_135]
MGGSATLLTTVMVLPLVDGIFPALVLAGALDSVVGVLEVGLLVFGGSATLAVVLAEMDAPPRAAARAVLAVGAVIVVGAAVEAALAPTIRSVVDLVTFERFAALVVAAVAAKTASARVGEYLPRPAVIVGLGLVASVDPAGATLEVTTDTGLIARAAAAALVGTLFALGAAVFAPRLRRNVDIDRFRFGSAVALGLLTLSILGFSFRGAPLAVVFVTGLLAFNPGGATETDTDASGGDGSGTPQAVGDGAGVGLSGETPSTGDLLDRAEDDGIPRVPGEAETTGEEATTAPNADGEGPGPDAGSGTDARRRSVGGAAGETDRDTPWS